MSTLAAPGPLRRGNRLRALVWAGAACLLLLPAVAMWLGVDGVHWTPGDFIVMGLMLAVACGLYEVGTRFSGSTAYRAGFALAVATGLATVWVNLAVGMFGGEANPINLLFAGVLLVAGAGALLARFRPRGMAWTMTAAAAAQLLAAALGWWAALVPVGDGAGGAGPAREALLVAGFALPWLGAAGLFGYAALRGVSGRSAA